MSREHDLGRAPSPWNNTMSPMNTPAVTAETESSRSQQNQGQPQLQQQRSNHNPSPPNTARPLGPLERPHVPTRSATLGTPDPDRNLSSNTWIPQSRSEDLNHSFSSSPQSSTYLATSPRPSPAFLSSAGSSRPSTPGGTQNLKPRSSSGHSDDSDQHLSVNSHVSANSASSSQSNAVKQTSVASSTSASLAST